MGHKTVQVYPTSASYLKGIQTNYISQFFSGVMIKHSKVWWGSYEKSGILSPGIWRRVVSSIISAVSEEWFSSVIKVNPEDSAARCSEISIIIEQSTRSHISEDSSLDSQRGENLKYLIAINGSWDCQNCNYLMEIFWIKRNFNCSCKSDSILKFNKAKLRG